MRLGKHDQSQHHRDWALHIDQNGNKYDLTDNPDVWYEAYDVNGYEWGWADDESWGATLDGE
eukprot:1003580-Pyramimonas_sp.AAC.1